MSLVGKKANFLAIAVRLNDRCDNMYKDAWCYSKGASADRKVSSSSILSKCLMTHKANIFTYLQQRLDFSVEAPPLPIPQFQIGSTIALQNSNGIELLSAFHIIPAKKIRLTFIIPKSLASSNFQSQEAYSIISFLKRATTKLTSSPDAYLAFYHAISSRLRVRTRTSQPSLFAYYYFVHLHAILIWGPFFQQLRKFAKLTRGKNCLK